MRYIPYRLLYYINLPVLPSIHYPKLSTVPFAIPYTHLAISSHTVTNHIVNFVNVKTIKIFADATLLTSNDLLLSATHTHTHT